MSIAVLFEVSLIVPNEAAAAFEGAVEPFCCAVTRLFGADGAVRITGLTVDDIDRPALDLAVAVTAAAAGLPPPEVAFEPLPDQDWLATNRERFAPFRIGRFLIQEPDDLSPIPPGPIPLRIEAGAAFGSGRHPSTAGCLLALTRLERRCGQPSVPPPPFRRVLDLGCGSGVLGIAAGKLWCVPVLASDLDPQAVAVTRANARINGLTPLLTAVVADGCRSSAIVARAPFDLLAANILARPLKRLAGELIRHLAPGGTVILSGLLGRDGNDVLAPFRARGLRLEDRIDIDGWLTLVLRRPAAGRAAP